jgi:membrane protein implicated in regulation of membrane protease activity
LYEPAPASLLMLPLMPEWYLVIAMLAALALLGLAWPPLLWALSLLLLAAAAPVAQAALAAGRAQFPVPASSRREQMQRRALTFCMHLMQPLARLIGRLQHGLTPWRRRGRVDLRWRVGQRTIWSESWRSGEQWVELLEAAVQEHGGIVRRGGDHDDWDLELRGGLCGCVRAKVAIEEHGAGKQLIRLSARRRIATFARCSLIFAAALAIGAIVDGAWIAAACLLAVSAGLVVMTWFEGAGAVGSWAAAHEQVRDAATRESGWEGASP